MPELHNPGTLAGTKVEQLNRGHRIPEGWKPYRWNGDPAEKFTAPEPKPEPAVTKPLHPGPPRKGCPSLAQYRRGCRCTGCVAANLARNQQRNIDRNQQRRAADAKRRAEQKREREAK